MLDGAGIATRDPLAAVAQPSIGWACAPVIARARVHFAEAQAIMARTPRRLVRAPRIMGEVYRRILDRLAARGFAPPRERVRVAKPQLILIILRYAFV